MRKIVFLLGVCAGSLCIAADSDGDRLFEAVREGNLEYLKRQPTAGMLQARDRRGATLLMHAAAFGNLDTLRFLLDSGADVNARNAFDATALLWAARDPEKARLLIARGADVQAASKQGRTPLMVASLLDGGAPTVDLLLKKGAEVNRKDRRGDTALGLAATIGEVEIMRLLLAKGADPAALNDRGESPLIHASKGKKAEAVRLLLEKKVDVNVATTSYSTVRNGAIPMFRMTALHRAAAFGPPEMVRMLIAAGANVNASDARNLTPLMFAVASDYPQMSIIRMLLEAGSRVNDRDGNGETALDWAEKAGDPAVIAVLKKAGASGTTVHREPKRPDVPRPDVRTAVSRSLALLQKTSSEFFTRSGCVGCHHQPLTARAQQAAKAAGFTIEEKPAAEQLFQMRAQWVSAQEEFLQSLNPGGGSNRLGENLLGMLAAGYKPDSITDSAVVDLAEAQSVEGSWPIGEEQPRPPLNDSVIASTARAIRAVQAFAMPARKQEFANRIARARDWLVKAVPSTTEDHALRLLGLAWAGAEKPQLREAAERLLGLQRPDGGWAGSPRLGSDAVSTGVALTALRESGTLGVSHDPYQRGVKYLLNTQFPDGSWYVRSRTIKFQPYFESGFPFGHDQWISVAATAWAVQALAPAGQGAVVASAGRR